MTFGEVIARAFEWLWEFWPVRFVNEWERGLRIRRGIIQADLEPGWVLFIPLLDEVLTEDVVADVNTTGNQTCTTADGHAVTFCLTYRFRIENLRLMYQAIQDHTSTIANAICGSASGVVANSNAEDLAETLAADVFEDIYEKLESWGLELEDISLFHLAVCRTYRVITDD